MLKGFPRSDHKVHSVLGFTQNGNGLKGEGLACSESSHTLYTNALTRSNQATGNEKEEDEEEGEEEEDSQTEKST